MAVLISVEDKATVYFRGNKIVVPVKVTTSADFDVFPAKSPCYCGGEASSTVHAVQYIGVSVPWTQSNCKEMNNNSEL